VVQAVDVVDVKHQWFAIPPRTEAAFVAPRQAAHLQECVPNAFSANWRERALAKDQHLMCELLRRPTAVPWTAVGSHAEKMRRIDAKVCKSPFDVRVTAAREAQAKLHKHLADRPALVHCTLQDLAGVSDTRHVRLWHAR
jgi:hypothetical protein